MKNGERKLVKTGEFDLAKLAEYCSKLKGLDTASELASRAKVNVSTISRILNQKISGPISKETMIHLGELINPNMGFTKEDFYQANGYEEKTSDGSCPIKKTIIQGQDALQIVSLAVINHPKTESVTERKWRFSDPMIDNALIVDKIISVRLENEKDTEDESVHNCWGFSILQDYMYYVTLIPKAKVTSRIALSFLQNVALYELLYSQYDKNEDDSERIDEIPKKMSYITYSKDTFDHIKKNYADIKTNVSVSVILVDLDKEKIVEELPLRTFSGYRHDAFFIDSEPYYNDDADIISQQEFLDMIEEEVSRFKINELKKDEK